MSGGALRQRRIADLHVDVAVKVHDHDDVNVNGLKAIYRPASGALYQVIDVLELGQRPPA